MYSAIQFYFRFKKKRKIPFWLESKNSQKLKASGLTTRHHSISNLDFLKDQKLGIVKKGYKSSLNEDLLGSAGFFQLSRVRYFLLKLERGIRS